MDKVTCLFPGRFQPFHNGHLLVVEGMTKVCGKIIIGIGGHGKGGPEDNPFTYQERVEMIQRALQAKNIIPVFDVVFIELEDMDSDDAWADAVLLKVGKIDKVWTGNEWTKECFTGKVQIQNISEVPGISAEEIREQMKSGTEWKEKLPKEVVSYIQEIEGVSRVKK
jgi:nicotinamide-nucleotide adenylyltransferase